jgi:uncharacterized protein YidB (DUF937 family)
MKTFKALGLAGGMVAAALVGGTLINAVSANPAGNSGTTGTLAFDETDVSEYCTQWQETFAAELGVAVEDLTPAAKAAAIATIDQAVANGDLPEDVAARMKEQIENAESDGCRLLGAGFHAWGRHAARVDWVHDWVSVAAETLGLEPSELVSELRGGQTLQEVAEAQGVDYDTLSQAIVDAAEEDLAALVEAGNLTQERADEILANLEERLADGEFPALRMEGRPGRSNHGPRLEVRGFGGFPGFPGFGDNGTDDGADDASST